MPGNDDNGWSPNDEWDKAEKARNQRNAIKLGGLATVVVTAGGAGYHVYNKRQQEKTASESKAADQSKVRRQSVVKAGTSAYGLHWK
jgi:DNA primase